MLINSCDKIDEWRIVICNEIISFGEVTLTHCTTFYDFKCFDSCVGVLCSSRHGELKAAFCIVGVQALAELNQWKDVLTWVSQHYGGTEQIPAKIMQMW